MADNDKNTEPSVFNSVLKWALNVGTYSIFMFIVSIIVFIPIFGLVIYFNLPILLVWLGIMGYVAVGIKNYHEIKPDDIKKMIDRVGFGLLIFGSTIGNYVSFLISIAVSLYIISFSNLGLLIPLFWFIGERELVKRGWFLSPTMITFVLVVLFVKRVKTLEIVPPDVGRTAKYRIMPS